MARPRSGGGDYYAWSDIYHGGESKDMPTSGGATRKVIVERNVTAHGEKVSQAELGISDEEWQTMIDGGSVRPYPVPEDVDEFTSPHNAVMAKIVNEDGDVDVEKLMEVGVPSVAALSTLPAATNPPAEEGKTLGETKPTGV